MTTPPDPEALRQLVRQGYGAIAANQDSCRGPATSCCGLSPAASEGLARHIGYTPDELAALPEGANMGLSCGNPNALAALQPGEVVLDLGAGGGFDVFIAGRKVGSTGRAIGVDMTPEMLAKARPNTATYRQRTGLDNVEFRLGEIEHLPVADNSVDAVISNCVINLSPDKAQVWREIARVLKPGGRVALSDLALLKPLPSAVAESVEALLGCVAGAVLVSETERMAREAGLGDIVLQAKSDYIDGMVDWQDPLYRKIVAHLPGGTKPSDYVTSLEIGARKPPQTDSRSPKRQGVSEPVRKLEVCDPAMCCATGVCGPEVDPKLVRFAADVKWLQEQGEAALPLLLADGRILASGHYPEREQLIAALGMNGGESSLFSPAVAELVAIGAAIVANCEPCLKYHYRQAQLLGVSKADMVSAVRMAATVKDSPHQAILRLADKLTGACLSDPETADSCCGNPAGAGQSGRGC